MARRQNNKLMKTTKGFEPYSRPLLTPVKDPISGLDCDGHDFINTLLFGYNFGMSAFDTTTPHHEDWIMMFVIMENEAAGRATVTKNIVELTGRAYGTVRSSLHRFEKLGYIEPVQRIGRSELYVPTALLKQTINQYAREFWPFIETLRRQSEKLSKGP